MSRLAPLGLLLAAGACAPAGDAGDPGLELGSYDDGGVLDDKALPSASYQAESRTGQSGCTQATNFAGYTGSGFMDFGGNGSWIEWNNIAAPAAGTYALSLRYANGAAGSRAAAILVNGQSIGSIPFAVTGDWDKWGTGSIDVSLARGNNTIRVLANTSAGGPNVDRMDVTATDLCPSDPNKVEPGTCGCGVAENACGGGVPGQYEAEAQSAQSGCSISSNTAGFTGTGFVDFGGEGTWIEWNSVAATQGGDFTLSFRYANGGANSRSASILVNGQSVGNAVLAATGAWDSWRSETITASLRQGNNTIRVLANTGFGGPNLDHMVVTAKPAADLCPSDANKTAPGICGCGVAEGSCNQQIGLPIEVLGPSGTQAEVRFSLSGSVADITHLLVTCHSCGYSDHALNSDPNKVKAAVQVNGGARVPLKHYTLASSGGVVGNAQIRLLASDDADYGGIGGAFRTNKLIVPISGLKQGENRISFTHVNADSVSIGFRVVDFNLLRGTSPSAKVLPSSLFKLADPTTWSPENALGTSAPATVQAAISEGKALWYRNSHLYDRALDELDGVPGGTAPLNGRIHASCSNCHAEDGRDLAYFNYSDLSIIERAYFHGVPRAEGRKIAAYIRSLDLPVVQRARPWNPPYQPGRGTDARPVYEWAAGAGLEAVLDSDAAMRPYLFPNGTSASAVKAVVDRFGTLNMRELPVALQFPDWNTWLPQVHPSDAFNTASAVVRQDEKGANVGAPFFEYLYNMAKADPSPRKVGDMDKRLEKWLGPGATCFTQTVTRGPGWRATNSPVLRAVRLGALVPAGIDAAECERIRYTRTVTRAAELAKHGLAAWMSVKQWELIHGNDQETRAATLTMPVCMEGKCVNASESRGWVTTDRFEIGMNVFTRAPHYVSYTAREFQTQPRVIGRYESNAWYHMQMVLNAGYRRTAPNHYPYNITFTEQLQKESGVPQSFRLWSTLIKMRQTQTNGNYGIENGLDLRTAEPFRYYSDERGDTSVHAGVGAPLWKALMEAMLSDFVASARYAPQADWDAASGLSDVQNRDSTQFQFDAASSIPFGGTAMQGRNTVGLIPWLRKAGVSEAVIGPLLDWSKQMWPRGPWDALRTP